MGRMSGVGGADVAELHTADMPMQQYDDVLDLTSPQSAMKIQTFESTGDNFFKGDYAAELKFNEDVLTIRVEPRAERDAPPVVSVAVNEDRRWLPVGAKIRIQRKFVGVLAQTQPFTVRTLSGSTQEDNPTNSIQRNRYRAVTFSVLHDPSPFGAAWLRKVMFEG